MSLINEIRNKRDSWMVRFEEHRQDDENEEGCPVDREKELEEISRNRKMVGVFPKKRQAE